MGKADLNPLELLLFHPAAHYNSPSEMLNDQQLSDSEKRVIFSSRASALCAAPWLVLQQRASSKSCS
ncbi:hypothetical protein ACFIOY_04290 [Bradyrhizobium sp. TZ2]